MRVLLISQYYKPIKSPVHRMVRIAEFFSNDKVTVLTSLPSYPTGILPKEYRNKLWTKTQENNIQIIRIWDFPTPNKGFIKRALNYSMFVISSLIAIFFMPPFDLVIVSSPNFLSGLAGLFANKIGNSKFIFDIRDLWPDSPISAGFLKNRYLRIIFLKLEKLYYRKADIILTTTDSIKNHIINEGISESKIISLLNSVDTEYFRPYLISKEKFGFNKNDFIVSFTGNHGKAQGLETTIKAARLLEKTPKIKFLFVGEGEDKLRIMEMARDLKNVIFWGEKSQEEILKIINFSDVGNISLAKSKIFQEAIPTKTLEYFACAKPVVASIEGTLANYINKYRLGLIYSADNPQGLTKAILKLYSDPRQTKKFGKNSRNFAEKFFSIKNFNLKLEQIKRKLT